MLAIKSDNKYVTGDFKGYKLTNNINFAYTWETTEECESIVAFMELENFEIVRL